MVSVIIPCYNASLYIGKCIEALSSQTFKDFKVIFVDDCSTDDTYHQLCQLQNKSHLDVKVIRNPINSGPAVSRNNGILAADTKYITFCDSDDWYESDFLYTLVGLLESNSADIAFCGYKVVDDFDNFQLRPVASKSGLIGREEAFSLDADSLCMLMVRTHIMKQTLLPNLRNGEDVATVPLLMTKARSYVVTDKCLYNYFRRHDSASQVPSLKVVESLISSYIYIKEHFPSKYSSELEFLGIKNVLYSAIITLFSFSYDRIYAKQILADFEYDFPNWFRNPYIGSLRSYKRVVVSLLRCRLFFLIKIITIFRKLLVK